MGENRGDLSHAGAHQHLAKCGHQEGIEEVWGATSPKHQGDVDTHGQRSCRNTELNADGSPNIEPWLQFSGFQLRACVSSADRLSVIDLRRISLGVFIEDVHFRWGLSVMVQDSFAAGE